KAHPVITFRPRTAVAYSGICFLEQSLLPRHYNEAHVRHHFFRAKAYPAEVFCSKAEARDAVNNASSGQESAKKRTPKARKHLSSIIVAAGAMVVAATRLFPRVSLGTSS